MMNELKHLKRYTRPSDFADFAGFDRREYFVAVGRHRDSDTLTESNFRVMLRRLGGESETVLVIRDSHFAVGWVESIYIHESDPQHLADADEMLGAIENYPALSEEDWSELEMDRAYAYWERASISDRIYWCNRYRVSIFAARRNEVPEDSSGELLSVLAE